jgi:hypothetical protein
MDAALQPSPRWHLFAGHALTVLALALGGLSSFQTLRAEVVELRAAVGALAQTEADHTRHNETARQDADRRRDADLQLLRDDVKEVRADLRELKLMFMKGAEKP